MMYFTADPHFNHWRMTNEQWRPFSSPAAWSEYFLDRINSRVQRNDMLWILGDFAFGGSKVIHDYKTRIVCNDTRIIVGNHDKESQLRKVFKFVWQQRTIKLSNRRFCFLSHYPTMFWDKSHYGGYHLYGHVHSQRQECIENIFPDMRILDVSPDNYARMYGSWDVFSENEIIDFMESKKGHDDVAFYKDYQDKHWKNRDIIC